MILRLSLSVAPPQTPSFSRVARAYSKQLTRTGHSAQMHFASSAASSESGKNTAGSKPLQAPCCLHDNSDLDIAYPLDVGATPLEAHRMCPWSQMSNPRRTPHHLRPSNDRGASCSQTPRAEGPLGAQILGRCHRHEPPLVLDAAPLDLFVR